MRACRSCEALPEESQQPEGPTLNSPRPPAHPGFKRGRSLPNLPTSLVEDIPLADIILANRGDPTTTETTEPICDVHGSSPPVTEPVMQVLTEDVPSICEQQRYVVPQLPLTKIKPSHLLSKGRGGKWTSQSSAAANVTSINAAFPTVRRAWTHG